jgi:hypothetical protein
MIIRTTPDKETLKEIYKTIQNLIKNQECYYTSEQIKKLKKDKNNKFIK